MTVLLICFFSTPREVDLEKVSPSVRWILRGVCQHIDCWWQISCWRFWEFAALDASAIIWKTKKIFWKFLEFTSKVKHFQRKDCVIVNVFPKLQTVKKLVRTLSKKRHFRTHFDSKNFKASQILAISPWRRISHVFLIILIQVYLENVSQSVRWNLSCEC